MSSVALMKHRCRIERATVTDVNGVLTPTWSTVASDVRCLVQDRSGGSKDGNAGRLLNYGSVGFFPPSTDIRPGRNNDQPDRIVMTAPAAMAGITFNVVSVQDKAGYADHLECVLERRPSL